MLMDGEGSYDWQKEKPLCVYIAEMNVIKVLKEHSLLLCWDDCYYIKS